jgi:transcriptional regulator with XRE-family HTH domain
VKDEDTGRRDYQKLLQLVREETGLTQAEVSDKTKLKTYAKEDGGVARSTISAYERGKRPVSADSLKRWLRRTARSRGIGHYAETDDGGQAAKEVRYIDPDDERRTLIEYVDVPLDFDIGEDDREYGLLNIHTGTYNENHSDRQLHAVHNGTPDTLGVAGRTLEILSPTNPKTGTELNLDEQNTHFVGQSGWTREADSVNYERELLDDGEQDVYLNNLPPNIQNNAEPSENIIFEVILWDENMTSIEWHVIGLWTGETWRDATILKDEGLGDWYV